MAYYLRQEKIMRSTSPPVVIWNTNNNALLFFQLLAFIVQENQKQKNPEREKSTIKANVEVNFFVLLSPAIA